MLKEILLIFKTHLDIGFTNYAESVMRKYFDLYIPDAISRARQLRDEGSEDRFIWTMSSYQIFEFLESAPKKARANLEQAILDGDIVWHAMPFTPHTELIDPSLYKFGLSISQRLDTRFGKKTIAGKQTDVPGHTMGVIPILAEAGVKLLHVGVNPASRPPDVPKVFRWVHPSGDDLMVMYDCDYGGIIPLPGTDRALGVNFTGDNLGPQSIEKIHEIYAGLRERFPGVKLTASTLNEAAKNLLKVKNSLPVVDKEIGDTWIHGGGTDPAKVARFRELSRLRNEWLESGKMIPGSDVETAFSLPLITVAEHTWGEDEKSHLADYSNYTIADLKKARKTARFKSFEASWAEQRAYIDKAVLSLGKSDLADEAKSRLKQIKPRIPSFKGFKETGARQFKAGRYSLGFSDSGAINRLRDRETGISWASDNNLIAGFGYQTFSAGDYIRLMNQYLTDLPDWAIKDFSKPGIENARARSEWHGSKLSSLHVKKADGGLELIAEMSVPSLADRDSGCPCRLILEVSADGSNPYIDLKFSWFEKTANRLPEAIWLAFSPKIRMADGWLMEKMGDMISPLDVVRYGSRQLHAIESKITYSDETSCLTVESLDAPLVAPGKPSLFDFNDKQPPMKKGMHFNLYNNRWGTNFPMWYEEDASFRFRIYLG